MKQFLLATIFCFQSIVTFGQNPIDGIYAGKEGGASIRFTKDFHYFYESVYCIGTTTDSGTYSFRGDTIHFHSHLSKKDVIENFFISGNTWTHKQNSAIDTLYFSIQNYTQKGLSNALDLRLNDSLLLHLDSLKYYDRKYYKFALFRNSDDGVLQVFVNGVKQIVPLDIEVDIQITENSRSLTPLTDKFVYSNGKMYSLDMLRVFNKKHYLYRQ